MTNPELFRNEREQMQQPSVKYKKILLATFFCILCAYSVFAEQPNTSGYTFEFRNDTLFVSGDSIRQTGNMVVVFNDRVNIYRKIYNDESDDLMEDHPADDLYNKIWSRERINVYNTPIDSIPDSVYIDCSKFCMPTFGYITSKFGPRRYRYHYGTDLKVQIGDTVRSAFNGQVRIVNYESRGYGHYVVIRHDNGLETVYAHLSKVLVDENMRIYCGEPIGLGGNTGRSTGSHLHFETRYLGNAINPELLFDFENNTTKQDKYLITKKSSFYHHQEQQAMAQAQYYTVRSGDNLSVIARRHGTSVSALCRLNKLRETSILQVGQRLRVR